MQILRDILKGLFYRGENFSMNKCWYNIGCVVFSWALITKVINNSASDELFLIYIGVMTASTSFSKYLANKQGKEDSK